MYRLEFYIRLKPKIFGTKFIYSLVNIEMQQGFQGTYFTHYISLSDLTALTLYIRVKYRSKKHTFIPCR